MTAPTTQVFKSGNSLALRIPKSLKFAKEGMQVEIISQGNELRIRPVKVRKLNKLMDKFSAFSNDFMPEGRASQEQAERDTL